MRMTLGIVKIYFAFLFMIMPPSFAQDEKPQSRVYPQMKTTQLIKKMNLSFAEQSFLKENLSKQFRFLSFEEMVCDFKIDHPHDKVLLSTSPNAVLLRSRKIAKNIIQQTFEGTTTEVSSWDETLNALSRSFRDDLKQGYAVKTIFFKKSISKDFHLSEKQLFTDLDSLGVKKSQIQFLDQNEIYVYTPEPLSTGEDNLIEYDEVFAFHCHHAPTTLIKNAYERVIKGEPLSPEELTLLKVPNLYVDFVGGEDYFSNPSAAHQEIKNLAAYLIAVKIKKIRLKGHTGGMLVNGQVEILKNGEGELIWDQPHPACRCSFNGFTLGDLMLARASTVAAYLKKLGVTTEIQVEKGSNQSNDKNRRVSVEYL